MNNPFYLWWLGEWKFQLVLMEGKVNIEGYGLGICLSTSLQPGESPKTAADRLVLTENTKRKSMYKAWKNNQNNRNLL